jgi:hypothetical protein
MRWAGFFVLLGVVMVIHKIAGPWGLAALLAVGLWLATRR